MISKQRCCAHCPGNPISASIRKEHECNVPTYIGGNFKLSSLNKYRPGEEERRKRLDRKPPMEIKDCSRNDPNMFSIAKKFHAENLQHQPLPDRVEDRIFANYSNKKNEAIKCECVRKALDRCRSIVPNLSHRTPDNTKKTYGPVLGCKKPESHMDLAICWETPMNPVYEPRKPSHVDGSNGGAAPAIFTLIHRKSNDSCGCIDQNNVSCQHNAETGRIVNECCSCCQRNERIEEKNKINISRKGNEVGNLCKELKSISLSKHVCGKASKPISAQNGRRSKYSRQLRHCAACNEQQNLSIDPRIRMQSANYFEKRTNSKIDSRNGLPPKGTLVPRPRTPFARRSFCIDTLTPPFSVVTGSRDADYPEHWRLTSIYQQSYRNPKKHRGTILNCMNP